MVTDAQVGRLKRLSKTEKNQELAAAKAGMDRKTAWDYPGYPRLPGERKEDRSWRTRADPFDGEWEKIREQVATNPGLEAKTIFEALQRRHAGKFADGQLRSCNGASSTGGRLPARNRKSSSRSNTWRGGWVSRTSRVWGN